jgi:hypothetical protein
VSRLGKGPYQTDGILAKLVWCEVVAIRII